MKFKLMLRLGYLISLKKDRISLPVATKKKRNPLIMKEKKVSNKQKQNSTLFQSKEIFVDIEKSYELVLNC
jgi:hypothetical protein